MKESEKTIEGDGTSGSNDVGRDPQHQTVASVLTAQVVLPPAETLMADVCSDGENAIARSVPPVPN
ncbi:unannotated protein [freshwater metagenome]|uniref:Unannotated protein n=1 Tax=freshwater metagenome TaxID=449393 RepID=A0A6J6ID08_9ZZZZ